MSKSNMLAAVDFETVYDAEYSLKKMSVHNYLADSRFSAYLVSVYNGDDISYVGLPEKFDWSLLDGYTVCAHNAQFDAAVYGKLVELGRIKRPVKNCTWACTADLTAWLGVRRNLADASKYLLGETVSKAVRENMKGKTAEECSTDAEVLAYGLKDAVTCYRLAEKYLHLWPLAEQRISRLNREAGYEGIALNMELVNKGIATLAPRLAVAEASLPWVAMGEKPLSANAAKAYGKSVGVPVPASFAKDDPDFIAWAEKYGAEYSWVKAMGEYRSVNTLLNRIKSLRDGRDLKRCRFPYGIKYFGASTGRFSGGAGEDSGGKFNMQNMPRKAMYGVDVRPMFTAAPGKVLIVSDYSQVEARFLLWRVGDEAALAPCFKGKSVYQAYAEATGACSPDDDLKSTNDLLYRLTKARVLGLGYQSGGPKFKTFAKTYGVDLTEDEAEAAVRDFRRRNPKIVAFWEEHHAALAYSARRRDATHEVELKSGRILTYWEPRIAARGFEVCQTRGDNRTHMYGGKLTENESQASCRDILCDAWLKCADAGYLPILNVHDELVFEVDEGAAKDAMHDIEICMTTCSPWAEGMPLNVDIGVKKFYTK